MQPICDVFMSNHYLCLCMQPIGDVFRPNKKWGPALVKHRRLVLEYVPEHFELDPWGELEKGGDEVYNTSNNNNNNNNNNNSIYSLFYFSALQPLCSMNTTHTQLHNT